jgi:predicted GH43/DUF377 family glycosyl hydrolase
MNTSSLRPCAEQQHDGQDRVAKRRLALDFNVEDLQDVQVEGPPALMARDFMSPFIWQEPDGRYGIMLRAVLKPELSMTDTGQIWAGWSQDGVRFTMLNAPSIVPGPDEHDLGGVEDPTVVRTDLGYVVYYTAVQPDRSHGELSYASGPAIDRLTKSGVALASSKSRGNTKEATVQETPDGQWRLFYEYAAEDASRVGLALGQGVAGPWTEQPAPFMPRANSWDDWHLSTGPLLLDDPDAPIMFYNGATQDARWRIGWIAFDRDCRNVVDRCIEPLITPPPVADRTATDIAFAGSVISNKGVIWLYYSLEDRRLVRAQLRRCL